MKPVLVLPPGLKGVIGAAAGLLKAAILSLKELEDGLSATGGGGFEVDGGAGDFAVTVGLGAAGFGAGAGAVSRDSSLGGDPKPGAPLEGGISSREGDWRGSAGGSACAEGGTGACSTGASWTGGRLGALTGRVGIAGSNFSTKFLGKMPSRFSPDSSTYSPVYQSASSSSVTVII